MRISSLSLVVAVPFLIAMAILLPLSLSHEYQHLFPWLILPVIVLTSLYSFRPQIDYWWIQRNEIGLDEPLVVWLKENSSFYNSLGKEGKIKFELRASLFLDSKDFIIKASKDHKLPEQYKLLAIHDALRITWNSEDYLFKNYDRVILYPHSFPTPGYKFLHPIEVHNEDGILLLSQPHLLNGFLKPKNFFNVGLYAWIQAYIYENKKINIPNIDVLETIKMNHIFPFSLDQIDELLGDNLLFPLPIHIMAYFEFPEKYKIQFPLHYNRWNEIFKG